MDAVSHTLMRAGAAIQERAQRARRLHHLLGLRSQNERPVYDARLDLAGEGVRLLAVPGVLCAESPHEPW